MLKRRKAAAANKTLIGDKTKRNEVQIYQPTQNDISNYERISKFFIRAQASKTTHPKLLTKLVEVYKEMPKDDFMCAFRACLRVPLLSNGCNDAVNRVFLFLSNFCATINDSDETGTLCPFNAQLFTHLLEGSADATQSIRLRSCQMINALLQSLDADKGLEVWLADAIQEAMLKRMRDKSPQVRVQAVAALQRLQDPENPECPVITSFLEAMRHDPCAEVRCRLLAVTARIKRTLAALVERHADVKDNVRKAAVLVVSRLHMRSLKIAEREALLSAALKDPSAMVRHCAESELLPGWLLNNDGDYIRFLGCLDVHTTGHENVCKEALFVLFRQVEVADLLTFANQLLVGKLLPTDQLKGARGPQKLVFWRCLVQYLREEHLEDDLDSILPNLTPFCVYMRQVLLSEELPKDEEELDEWSFVVSQLVMIATGFDLADEMGRSELRRLLLELLTANKSNTLTAALVGLLELAEPGVQPRLIALAELVSDLHRPLAPATQLVSEDDVRALTNEKNKLRYQLVKLTTEHEKAVEEKDYGSAKTLDDELTAAKERLGEINKRLAPVEEETVVRRDVTDPDTLSQCLNIVVEMMQDGRVSHLTPELRTLMQDFVEPVFQQPDLSEPLRLLCLRCFGCFCLLDKQVALEKITIFFVPIAEESDSPCAVVSLQAIFDLFFRYGVAEFGLSSNIDERIELRSQSSPGANGKPGVKLDVLDSMLFSLNDYDMPALVVVAATGFCRLLLAGHLSSYHVLVALVLAWFHQAETHDGLRLALGDFFSTYTSNRIDGIKLVVQCVDPLVDELLKVDDHDKVDISEVLLFVTSLIRPGINPKFKENVHLELAVQMCDKIIDDPFHDRAPFFAQSLSRLDLAWGTIDVLQNLRTKALEIEPLFAEDKLAKRFVTKFLSNITVAEAVLAEEAPLETDADEPAAEEPPAEVPAAAEVDVAMEAAAPLGERTGEEEDRMEIESTDSNKTQSQEVQHPVEVIAGSSSPVNGQDSVSQFVIPETDSESSD